MPLDGWMQKCGELETEIERLRAALEEQNGAIAIMHTARDAALKQIDWLRRQLKDYKIAHESVARDNERLDQERNTTIEECAQLVESYPHLAAAIRELKDKSL